MTKTKESSFYPIISRYLRQNPPQTRTALPTTYSQQLSIPTPRPPNHTQTRQGNSLYSLRVETNIYLSYTTTTPTPSTPKLSRTGKPWRSLKPGRHAMNTSNSYCYFPILHGYINKSRGKSKYLNFLILLDSECSFSVSTHRRLSK